LARARAEAEPGRAADVLQLAQRRAVGGDRPGIRGDQTGDHAHARRLARPVGPERIGDRAVLGPEVDRPHRGLGAEALGNARDFAHSLGPYLSTPLAAGERPPESGDRSTYGRG